MILEAKGIRKTYFSGTQKIEVLKGVDFKVESREFASIRGVSGSGKTTLLNILAGLEVAGGGELAWCDRSVSGLGLDELAGLRGGILGMVFQSYYLVPEINALENATLGARISGTDTVRNLRIRATDLLERVGLGERLTHMPNTLSGGERQRVAIVRAMLSNPKVILADEPTGNLDEKTGDAVMSLLRDLCKEFGTGLVLVTHNESYARMADAIFHMKEGVLGREE